jgi:predicted RNA binding protein YcfA (HicA-like mRNA interferase family)
MKVKEILKLLEEDGWYLVRTKGSHRQLKRRNKPGCLRKTAYRCAAGYTQ